ncbi:MAG: hypothetical protein HN337_05650 [Deltaproteobacteria bacterium]|jgi:Kef-type K+ transport system membrane component KefB|nr:hypothetical protein [Deltaproteobacteria bacterium]
MSALTLTGLTIFLAYYCGRATLKLKLPSLIGYMLLGASIGLSGTGWFDEKVLQSLGFINEIALGFVAFSIGLELNFSSLRQLGKSIIIIILSESLVAFSVVLVAVYALTQDLALSLIFGAMAPASAPAGTVAVIQEFKAKGTLTKALYAVVGFDDGLAIIIFAFAASIARNLLIHESSGHDMPILPGLIVAAREILFSCLVGVTMGLILRQLTKMVKDERDMTILTFAAVLVASGISASFHLSLILTNIVVGLTLVNTQKHSIVSKISNQLSNIMPLLFVLFFSLAGAHLNVRALPSLGLIGIVYILGRSFGLVGGAWLGATVGRAEEKIKKYLGMGILSQAGVAIGLSLIVKHDFDQIASAHAREIGVAVITTITATSIIFEIIGPIMTKIALSRAGEIEI